MRNVNFISVLISQRHLNISRRVLVRKSCNRAEIRVRKKSARNTVLHVIEGIEQVGTEGQPVSFPRHAEDLRDAEIDVLHTVEEKRVASEQRRVDISTV